MEFDLKKFETTNFEDRTKDIQNINPELEKFFIKKKGEKKGGMGVWKIRGLTGIESAITKQAVDDGQMELIKAVILALGGKLPKELAEVVKTLAGIDKESTPREEILKYGWLEYGLVEPKMSRNQVVKFAFNFHQDFLILTNEISGLSGQGRLGE
jgi:hypothetical protein